MIPQKSRFSTFNDGVLWICEPESASSDFGAVKNTLKKDQLVKLGKLDYKKMSKRDQDLDFAERRDRTLNTKVKCRLRTWLTSSHQILIGNMLYSIIYIDMDNNAQEMYLYLEEVRKLS